VAAARARAAASRDRRPHGINTLKHQPAKIAAIEGLWDTERAARLNLFGIPDMKAETTRYA
jgi:cytochrome d ubiquinol oxidase subunit I